MAHAKFIHSLILLWCFIFLLSIQITFAENEPLVKEARAIWISRWSYNSPEDIKMIMKNVKETNFNIVIFQVRGQAESYYKSDYEPWAEQISPDGNDPGWDPLAIAVEEAHRLGLQLHAWVNVYPAWRGKVPPKSRAHIWHTHPEWFCYTRDGKKMELSNEYVVLNPAHPEVQEYLYNIFMEIIQKYDIDGLHFDYVRYYGASYSFDSVSLKRFYDQTNATPDENPELWNEFRREQVTALVRKTYQGIKSVKPNLMLSASVWGDYDDGYTYYLQDSHRWLAEGIIDFICPMMYTPDNEQYRAWAKRHLQNQHQRLIYPGTGPYQLKTAEDLVKQIEIAREEAKNDRIRGITVFDYLTLFSKQNRTKFAEALIAGPFAQPAIAPGIEDMWWKTSTKADVVGPLITELRTIPQIVRAGEPFRVACKITDGSGIEENSVSLSYTIYSPDGTENIAELKMIRDPQTRDIFTTAESIPALPAQTKIYLRVRAYDTAENLGESEYTRIHIYHPSGNYIQGGDFGSSYKVGQYAVCDQEGKVWLTELRPPNIRIFEPNGLESAFSKISVGLDSHGREVPILNPSGIDVDRKGYVYVSCDTTGRILKFRAKDGKPFPGFELPYVPGDLDISDAGYLYVVEKLHNRWHIYTPEGKEVPGSPFGDVTSQTIHINRGIGVTRDGKTVYIADEASGAIHKWVGGIKKGIANYEQKEDLIKVQDASGAVDVDRQGNIYVSNYGLNCVHVFNTHEQHIADLVGGTPPVTHPRGVAFTDNGHTLYILIMDYGPLGGKLQKWMKK
ncbi:MAG: family 10 glycosylhydrolase [bacterium]|nr:family 10 glycosylhydrolase [bacterium]